MPQPSATVARGTAWALAMFYLLIVFEFFYMATPFAVYFYGAYLPGLEALNRVPHLAWLTSFFLPHFVLTSSAFVNSAAAAGTVLSVAGVLGFTVGALQVYSRELLKRGAAVGGVYRFVRHPQYASLILAGAGMLLLWPRFLMVVLFVTMLFVYNALASVEEHECLQRYGQTYADYLKWTPRFLPLRISQTWMRSLTPRPWPVRVAVGTMWYAAILISAMGVAFGIRGYTIAHLYCYCTPGEVYIALEPTDSSALQKLALVAAADVRMQELLKLDTAGNEPRLNYVMPWDWFVPEIPMIGVQGHSTPARSNPRRTKIVYTRAALPPGTTVQGLEILRNAIRTEPVLEVWLDESGQVAQILRPPQQTLYGRVPVPVF